MPSHCPPQLLPSDPQTGRVPCGAPVTGVHEPSTPETLHASHCPLHAPSQHTPSTQCPLVHMFATLQPEPGPSFGRQMPSPVETKSQ